MSNNSVLKKLLDPKLDSNSLEAQLLNYGIENYTITSDNKININGDVNLTLRLVGESQLPFKFGKVTGNFECNHNKLSSFENFPDIVNGSINLVGNKFQNLKGITQNIGGDLNLSINPLKSFDGFPKNFNGKIRLLSTFISAVFEYKKSKVKEWLKQHYNFTGEVEL